MGKCEKCGAPVEPADAYEFAGRSLCEDCYLEQKVKPVACNPWAVHTARSMKGAAPQLTQIQERILDLIKTSGPLEASAICGQLGISEEQFQNNFATLRHMELARGFRDGPKTCYTVFETSC
jgi:hypothetical protein